MQGSRFTNAYLENPLELSTHLFLKTREQMLLRAKLNSDSKMQAGGRKTLFYNRMSKGVAEIDTDLETHFSKLNDLMSAY